MKKLKAQEMKRLSAQEFQQVPKIPLTIVLDNVRSMHNVGAVFRTADAFRIENIILCGICSTPPNSEIHKTALGAELTVKWQYFKQTQDAVYQLKQQGYHIIAIEQAQDSTMLQDMHLNPQQHYAIILGHEVFGVQQEIVDLCDQCVEIPQYGTKHSLNVSVAGGIVIYEIFRQLNSNTL